MESYLICLAVALVGGLMLSRVTKLLNLPAVTAYLVAGLLLGPFCLGTLDVKGLGFGSLDQVQSLHILTQTALGFIAFSMGSEFRLHQLKSMGAKAIIIGIAQAVITTLLVDAVLVGVHLLFPNILSLPAALVLGAIASATAPAATLMVVRQYKADGPLTRLLMLVVAIDDAVGLLLFSVSFGVASALENGAVNVLIRHGGTNGGDHGAPGKQLFQIGHSCFHGSFHIGLRGNERLDGGQGFLVEPLLQIFRHRLLIKPFLQAIRQRLRACKGAHAHQRQYKSQNPFQHCLFLLVLFAG